MQGLQLDAQAALEHVLRRPDIDPTRVRTACLGLVCGRFGLSLGTCSCARHPPASPALSQPPQVPPAGPAAAQVVLFGRSLGGAVAAYGAARYRRHVAGLILENTFTSVVDVVPHVLPMLRPLVGPGK